MESKEGLKLIGAIIDNFKNIDHRVIKMEGKSIIISGKNGTNKSSLIQALLSPVDAKWIPSHAIKEGEERGSVQLELAGILNGVEQKYNIDIYFSNEHKSGYLVITDKDGAEIKKGADALVKTLVGNIGFDIFQFINMGITATGRVSEAGVKKQIEILKSLIPQASKEKIFKIEQDYEKEYKERTKNNATLDVLETEFKACPFSAEDIAKNVEAKKFTEEQIAAAQKDVQDIVNKVETWNKVNDGLRIKKEQREKLVILDTQEGETFLALFDNLINQTWDSVIIKEFLQKEAKEMRAILDEKIEFNKGVKKTAEQLDIDIAKGDAWITKNVKPTVEAVSKKLDDMKKHNSIIDEVQAYSDKHKRILDLKETIKKNNDNLKKFLEDKKAVFSSAEMPVPGLSFTENEIYFTNKEGKTLPFNEDHIPKSHIIAIGVKIAMAMNPNLKVLVIKDGSLLDEDTLKTVVTIADKNGYQLLIEIVDNEHTVPEIKFTEEVINKSK